MSDIIEEIQKEVIRINNMINTTKALFPNGNVNFTIYEMTIERAEKAIREQDVVSLVQLLPELKEMS
jgi:hypothetical protein